MMLNEAKLIQIADGITAAHDPCAIDGGSCAAGKHNPCCYNSRFRREDPNDTRCLYLGPAGCENINLECKLWFCGTAIARMKPGIFHRLKTLEGIAADLVGPPLLGEFYVGADRPA